MDEEKKEEENNNQLQNTSWWNAWPSWLQTAKEKSSTAIEFMKRDLNEFTEVVQTDAVAAVSSTAAMLKEKLTVDNAEAVADRARQSISSVIETITDVFIPQKEIEDGELMIIKNSEPVVMDWWQRQLFLIRKDPKTFCHEPEGHPEMYENWLESFNLAEYQDEMTEIMINSVDVQSIYDKLVPVSVSHLEFWQRYFYRVHLLHKAEAKRAELMRKADQISVDDFDSKKDVLETSSTDILKKQSSRKTESVLAKSLITGNSDSSKIETNHNITLSNDKPLHITSSSDKSKLDENEVSKKLSNTISEPVKSQNVSNETTSEQLSQESSDESRSSPIESLGKDSSTGDDWEKDFDLEINESDLKKLNVSVQFESNKEEEDDWEKWQ